MATAWQAHGLRGELQVQPGKNRFTAIEGLAEADSPLCQAVVNLMTRCERG